VAALQSYDYNPMVDGQFDRDASMITTTIKVFTAALLIFPPQPILAQTPPETSPPSAQQESTSSEQLLSDAQLDALLAPIALYPDALLSEVLMASTYPLEVVEADRWVESNKNLKGDALKDAVGKQSWDDSVKSLVATPSVLDMMSQKLSWTQQLGDAVLAQQPDIVDAIQRLRTKAQANNKLVSNQQQTVSTQQQDGKQVIVITPTQPTRSMCRITIRPSFTERGPIRPIRHTTGQRRATSLQVCSRLG